MCHPQRANVLCSKLSEFDDLCGRVAERQQLKGFYRAFMSTSTQWLSNLFDGVCVSAKMVNMHVSCSSVRHSFHSRSADSSRNKHYLRESKTCSNNEYHRMRSWMWKVYGHSKFSEVLRWTSLALLLYLDFHTGGTEVWPMELHPAIPVRAQKLLNFDWSLRFSLGLDWSRQDSRLSGIASRLPDGTTGLFHYQYAWPCSISDSNMGILCIETNCDKRNYYKH